VEAFALIYLDHALAERRARCASEDRAFTREDLRAAIMAGAVERVRPKMMTVTAIIAGLLPILWESRHRLRAHAAHCRANDRRHGVLDGIDLARDPRGLRDCQGVAADERSRISCERAAHGESG
jgi:hypothetical protein